MSGVFDIHSQLVSFLDSQREALHIHHMRLCEQHEVILALTITRFCRWSRFGDPTAVDLMPTQFKDSDLKPSFARAIL